MSADRLVDNLGPREPAGYRFHPDLVEALIGLGDLSAPQAQADRLTQRARALGRPWTLATGARCRGLLLAAAGDLDGAEAAMRDSLEHHECLEMPFERGRTMLAYRQVLRRRNERRRARAIITDALAAFENFGAASWSAIARAELKRIPVRPESAALLVQAMAAMAVQRPGSRR